MKIIWNSEEWEVKYCPGKPGRWTLEKYKPDGTFVSSVSWFLYFPHVNYFIEFLREEESKS